MTNESLAQLEQGLIKIGLSSKEAKVYLASLRIGPATAQQLAVAAVLNRPTTYTVIEELIGRQLLSAFVSGKKRYFRASPPNHLLYLLDAAKKEITEKEDALKKMQEQLDALPSSTATEAKVSVHAGFAGLRVLQDDILQTGEDVCELVSFDEARKFVPPADTRKDSKDIRKDLMRNLRVKHLHSYSGPLEEQYSAADIKRNIEFRRITDPAFPIPGEVVIYGDKVAMISYRKEPMTFIVEDAHISASLRSMFLALWDRTGAQSAAPVDAEGSGKKDAGAGAAPKASRKKS